MVLTEMPWASSAWPSARELLRPGGADVGLAVGQQHDAVEPPRVLELGDLGRAGQHAGVDGGGAAHADLADEVGEERRGGDVLRRHQHVDAVVEDHDRGDVGGSSRLIAMMAASRAWAMASPCMEPERSMTKATLTGVRFCAGSRLAALQGDAQVVLVGLAALHDGLRQPRLEPDRLAGLCGRCNERAASGERAQSDCAM